MERPLGCSAWTSAFHGPRSLSRLAGAVLLGVATLGAGTAKATIDGPPRVVIIDSDGRDDTSSSVPRLSAELTYAGYDVVFDPPEADLKPLQDLARTVVELNAVAGIWLAPRRDVVWVSTVDPDDGAVLIREVSIVQDDPEFVAIRVVELVQASLQPEVSAPAPASERDASSVSSLVPPPDAVPVEQDRWRCAIERDAAGQATARCRDGDTAPTAPPIPTSTPAAGG